MSKIISFAKIFNSDSYGQIVVLKDEDLDGIPSLKFMIRPEGFNTCMMGTSFTDDDIGYEKLDKAFDETSLQFAESFAKQLLEFLGTSMRNED